jgi:hypothetical protein
MEQVQALDAISQKQLRDLTYEYQTKSNEISVQYN